MQGSQSAKLSTVARRWICIIALLLFLPALLTVIENHEKRSQLENRPLQSWPEWQGVSQAPAYFGAIDGVLEDHTGTARRFNQIYRKLRFYAFQMAPVPNVSLGSDGFVFLNSHNVEQPHSAIRNLCMRPSHRRAFVRQQVAIDTIVDAFAKRNMDVALGVAVSKPVLYPENLPDEVPTEYRDACALAGDSQGDLVTGIASLSRPNFPIYYPLADFLPLKDTEAFYPKENFHWDGRSAHVFAKNFLTQLGIDVPNTFGADSALTATKGDLRNMGFARTVDVWDYPYAKFGIRAVEPAALGARRYYAQAIDVSEYLVDSPLSNGSALVLSNSFGAFTSRHLAPGFAHLTHINLHDLQPEEYSGFYGEYLDSLKPDQIILLIHDEQLVNPLWLEGVAAGLQAAQAER